MFIKFYRTLKTGIQNFYRNGWLSIATISVIVITLFIVNLQIAVTVANDLLLKDVQDRVSVSVYFKPDVSEADVMKVRDEFSKFQEVKEIDYISREQALEQFKERNKDNETIRKSIEELGSNPLGATLNIKAHETSQYELISSAVEQSKFKEMISKVNYHKYKDVIENLSKEAQSNQRVAIILGVTLSVIAILITFNSIRITMYAYRQEIEIMRLVGASNTYIRLPFVWEGVIYGFVGSLIVIPMVYAYLRFVSSDGSSGSILPFSNQIYLNIFLNDYFLHYLWLFAGFQIILGILLGVISSMIAIRKYLKV